MCPLNTSRVFIQHVPVCTGTTRKRVPTCARGAGIHGGRVERTHGDVWSGHTEGGEGEGGAVVSLVFSSVKQMFLTFLSILTGCWVHLLSPIFCLPKFAHMWIITCFRGSPKKPLDLTYIENIENGASSIIERSALARCNVLIIRNRNTIQTILFSDLRAISFLPFLLLSIFL